MAKEKNNKEKEGLRQQVNDLRKDFLKLNVEVFGMRGFFQPQRPSSFISAIFTSPRKPRMSRIDECLDRIELVEKKVDVLLAELGVKAVAGDDRPDVLLVDTANRKLANIG